MENPTEVTGTATIRVRNLVIENVRVTLQPDGEFRVPFKISDVRYLPSHGGSVRGGSVNVKTYGD